jgi:hypothetical protein
MKARYFFLIGVLVFSSCAKVENKNVLIDTVPQGAKITVSELDENTNKVIEKEIGISPVTFEINYQVNQQSSDFQQNGDVLPRQKTYTATGKPKYTILATKDGYFNETSSIIDNDPIESGKIVIQLQESPLWAATENSSAANQWMQLIVNQEISASDMWQRVVDAVTKRFSELKEYDYNSGYLVTMPKIKKYITRRGVFLLRTKFLATVMERNPLTYRLKIESDWSDVQGNTWHPYPRVFKEDAALVKELMARFQAY